MKNNLTLLAREGKAKASQNTGGGASQQSTAQHDSARVFKYFNTQMARFLSIKKGEATVSEESCSWAQGRATSANQPTNHALITHLSPTQTVSLARIWKYVACLLIAFFVGVGNVWGGTITWNTADNSGSSDVTLTANHTFTGDDASTILTYANPNGCKRIKSSGGLYMNGASQYNSSKNQRHFTFKAPSAAGTVSITFAAINGKNDGTGSTTVRIYGGTTVAYDVNTLNSSLTSPVIEGLKTGTSDVIITFLAKCTIKEIKWTDVASTTYTTVYANDFTASPMGAAAVSYSSMSAMASAVTGWTGWDNTYAKGYASSSSSCSATLTFATPLALNSDGTDCGRIRVYWGHSSYNKTLGLKVNGSSVTFSPTTVATTIYPTMLNVAEYTIPKATTSISSIQPSGSGSTGTYLFRIEVLTHSSCSAPTSPTITATPASAAYTVGDNISLTASATGTGGSTTYTWYKGIDWATASAGSSIGSVATYTKNSCVEGDAGTYWCNISNGTGCEVQVSKTITVAAAAKAYTVTAASNNDSYGTAEAAASALDEDETTTVTATAEDGYKFVSWAVSGTGASLTSETDNPTTLTMGTANATVTATFRALNTYTMSYAKGSAEGVTGSKDSETKTEDAAFTLPDEAVFELDGYVQTGWATSDGGDQAYELGGSYTTNSDQAFYPVWTELKTITYHANGGNGSMSDTKGYGSTALRANTFTKDGYVFAGWATSQVNANAGTIAYTDGANVTLSSEDVDLYAIWYTILYSFTPATSGDAPAIDGTISSSEGGTMTYTPTDGTTTGQITYTSSGLQFGNGSTCAATVTTTNAIKEGDVIIATIFNNNTKSARGLKLCTTGATSDLTSGAWSWQLPSGKTEETKICYYTVNSSSALKNATSFRLIRNNTVYLQKLVVAKFVAPTTPSFTSPASEPDAAAYYVDETVSPLEVTATGEPTPTLQWYKNSTKSTSGAASISGATNASYTPSSAAASDFYYYCVATNVAGSAQSEYFRVTVSEALTFNATYSSAKGTAPDAAEDVSNVTLPTIDPVTGFAHTAWTADKDVTVSSATVTAGTEIAVGTQVFLTANTTFTAVWSTAYTLTLDPKGGATEDDSWTYDNVNDLYSKVVAEGADVDLPTFTKENRAFKTWRNNADAEDEYAEEGSVTVSADMTLNAIWNATVEQVIYSWESPDGTPVEFGGTAKYYNGNTDASSTAAPDNRVNFANKPIHDDAVTQYYTLRLDKANDYSAEHVRIALDNALAEGDKIKITAYQTKSETKEVAPKIANASNEVICTTSQVVNLYGGGTPTTQTKTLNASAEGATTLKLTRSETSTTVFITKLQIVREVTTEESNLLTVTFNSNGGSDVASVVVVSGSKVAKPADPTKSGYRFKEWQLSGSAYDFSTAVTANITLDAVWTQLYAVTYAAGEGSGTMAADAAAEGDKVTLKANGFTAPDGKVFDAWVVAPTAGGDPITVTAGKFTMPAAAVTATATWKATYTVNYIDEDGTTPLGSEEVAVGSHPTASGISAEQDYKTLTWLQSSVAVDLDDVSAEAGEEVDLVASYAPAYASSINIEQWVLDNRKNNSAFRAVLDAKYFKYANLNDLDSLTAEKNDGDRNEPFLGQKWKLASSEISFLLKSGSTVRTKFGNVGSNVNVVLGDADPVAKGKDDLNAFEYTATADIIIKFQGTGTGTVVFKQIMIDEPIATVKLPAVVTYDANGGTFGKTTEKYTGTPLVIGDATPADGDYEFEGWHVGTVEGAKIDASAYVPTKNVTLVAKYVVKPSPFSLSALTFTIGAGEAQEVGYVEGTYEYDVELPYAGSYETITVAYTLADGTSSIKSGAVLSVTSLPGAATFTVVAANETEKTYTVNFIKDAKDGLEIIGAVVTGNTTATVTGLYKGDAAVNLNSKKIDNGDYYIYVTLKEGQTLQDGDVLVVDVNAKADIGTKALEICTGEGNLNNGILTSVAVDDYSTGENSIVLASVPAGATSIGLKRSENLNAKINGLKVYRPMNPVLKSITFDGTKIEVAGTTVEETLPYATDLSAVTAEYYWNGAGTAVVTTNEGAWAWGDNTYVLTDKDGDATTYTITLTRATRSSDKSLSSLTVDGSAIELKEGVYDYIYEYPYGTNPATVPAVAAEANDAHASVGTITQAASTAGTASFTVTAEDESEQEYTVSFKISRVPGLVIYDGSTSATAFTATSYEDDDTHFAWSIGSSISVSADNAPASSTWGGKTYTKMLKNFKPKNGNNEVSFTVPSGYLAKIRLVGSTNSNGDERKMFIAEEATNDASKAIGNYVITSSTYEAQGFVTELLMPGTYYLGSTDTYRLFEFSAQLYPIDKTRTGLAQGMLGTVCLPNGGIMVGASIFEIAYMDYEADGTTPHKIYFDEVIGGIMEAGMPYVILPNEGSSQFVVTYTDNANAEAKSKNGLVGYLGDLRALAANDYFIYNNMFYYVSSEDAASGRIRISAERAYINLSQVPGYHHESPKPAPVGRRRIAMSNANPAPQVATGMDEVQGNQVQNTKVMIDGQLFIIHGEKMYNATGILVK